MEENNQSRQSNTDIVKVNLAEDYYIVKWMDMMDFFTVSAIFALFWGVIAAIVFLFATRNWNTSAFIVIKNFFEVILTLFPFLFCGFIIYKLGMNTNGKKAFLYTAANKVVHGFLGIIPAAFGSGFGLVFAMIAFVKAFLYGVLALILLGFICILSPVTIVFYAIMYLLDKKIKISPETGEFLDNSITVISVILTFLAVRAIIKM